MTTTFTAEPGRIVIARQDGQLTLTRKGEGQWLGLILMAQGRHEECCALLEAYRTAWPDSVPSPGSLAVGLNIEIEEVAP